MNKQEELALVERAVGGDQHALAQLCRQNAKLILYQASKAVPSYADAEDVAQTVILKICQNIGKLRDPQLFYAWVGRITINECRQFMRSGRFHREHVSIEEHADFFAEEKIEFLPHAYAENAEIRAQIIDLIEKLPQKQREATLLYYFRDLSSKEVALAMDISVKSVHTHLDRARKRIRKELERSGQSAVDIAPSVGLISAVPVLRLILQADAMAIPEQSAEAVIAPALTWLATGEAPAARVAGKAASFMNGSAASLYVATGLMTACVAIAAIGSPYLQTDKGNDPMGPTSSSGEINVNAPQPSIDLMPVEDLDIDDENHQRPESGDVFPADTTSETDGIDPPVNAVTSDDPAVPAEESAPQEVPGDEDAPEGVLISTPVHGKIYLVDINGNAYKGNRPLTAGIRVVAVDRGGRQLASGVSGEDGGYSLPSVSIAQRQDVYVRLEFEGTPHLAPAALNPLGRVSLRLSPGVAAQAPDLYIVLNMAPELSVALINKGDCGCGHVNPAQALLSDFSLAELEQSWQIVAQGSKQPIYSGSGGVVDEAFEKLLAGKRDGLYTIVFTTQDALGNKAELRRDFRIDSGEIHAGDYA